MFDRHDLTGEEWARLEPLLPDRTPRRGGRWADHRALINGVLWRTRTGVPWRDLPSCYGHWKTVYNRHRRWSADHTWDRILAGLRRGCDQGDREWTVGVDSTVTRAHQHAAGARRPAEQLPRGRPRMTRIRPTSRLMCLLRRRGAPAGGLTSKLHMVADRRCRPIAHVLTAGHRHDSLAFEPVLAAVCIPRGGGGRPRTRPDRVLADKAYSSKAIRAYCAAAASAPPFREPADRQAHRAQRGRRGGRPLAFDPQHYRQRNVVERCINKLKSSGPWPPATTSAPTSTPAPSTSSRSEPGSKTQYLIYGTGPSPGLSPTSDLVGVTRR